jgi:uncharacterized protein (DUF1697 family)
MTPYIALLRGVNLGGNRMVAMADLRALCERLGFQDARTLLQSGNLVFQSAGRKPAALEKLLEAETARRLRIETTYFIRTASEWDDVIARNPLTKEAQADPGRMVVMCLKDAPARGAEKTLRAAIKGPEIAHVDGREAYIYFPDGQGRSKLTTALLDKSLGTVGTARNWNTVKKIAASLAGG